ncbi:preprotein translocase subunit YajC [bacterium SCSIO 12643]|nr:preprotein translocase subunit YajC [bacterium SCSIO 12643]
MDINGILTQFGPLILIGVVFYFFIIRPQLKRAKDAKKFREAMRKGDKVVTIGGIHGKILEIRETTIVLEAESKTRFVVERSAISPEFTSGSGESDLALSARK